MVKIDNILKEQITISKITTNKYLEPIEELILIDFYTITTITETNY